MNKKRSLLLCRINMLCIASVFYRHTRTTTAFSYGSRNSSFSTTMQLSRISSSTNTQRFGLKMWGESPSSYSPKNKNNKDRKSSSSSSSWYGGDDSSSSNNRGGNKRVMRNRNAGSSNGRDRRPTSESSGGGWDEFDNENYDRSYNSPSTKRNNRNSNNSGRGERGNNNFRRGNNNNNNNNYQRDRSFRGGNQNNRRNKGVNNKDKNKNPKDIKMNLRFLEASGFEHVYGLAPVLNALGANRRDFSPSTPDGANDTDNDDVDDERLQNIHEFYKDEDEEDDDYDYYQDTINKNKEEEIKKKETPLKTSDLKPQAQATPYLFVQQTFQEQHGRITRKGKSSDKTKAAQDIIQLAQENDVPIAYVEKGDLNALSNNRPHQGYVLRCRPLSMMPLDRLPKPSDNQDITTTAIEEPDQAQIWLVLDEVVDPQNFGALLRSAFFFFSSDDTDSNGKNKIGIMVCAKNSSPPTPAVSAASAGALELMTVYSTNNLIKTLNQAKLDGWRILGASADENISAGSTEEERETIPCTSLNNLKLSKGENVVLVMGSEGHGLRTLVSRACTEFVKIPPVIMDSAVNDEDSNHSSRVGVDSLNVSVSGGILLWKITNDIF